MATPRRQENEKEYEEDDSSGDISVSDDEEDGGDRPSETRMIREMGEGNRELVSSRPAPTRLAPAPKPAPEIIKTKTLFNYYAVKPIPVSEPKSHKKQQREEVEVVEPEVVQVRQSLRSPFSSLF